MSCKLKITFVLPGSGAMPVGGFKVVYEYANRLSRRGHQITVIHPSLLQKGTAPRELIRSMFRYVYRKTFGGYKPQRWFEIDSAVRMLWVPSPAARYIPDGDAVIATAWQTADWVADYPESKGSRGYIIQQVETWHGMQDRVLATWKLPLRKFVISHWLMDVAESLGLEADYLPNGLDFQRFSLTNPPEQRIAFTVMMLYHSAEDKGSADGLKALTIAHEQIPELRVTLFGTPRKPVNLPTWIQYHRCPDQRILCELYNSNAVFVAPSWTEGWALPPGEALMCGAALAATDIGGHRGYAIHEETALLSPPQDPSHLADNILRLIRDNPLRITLAMTGYNYIQQFTWQRSVKHLETALLQSQQPTAAIQRNA
jgi:glycosyltransferase involved in cell wall biosynthesis